MKYFRILFCMILMLVLIKCTNKKPSNVIQYVPETDSGEVHRIEYGKDPDDLFRMYVDSADSFTSTNQIPSFFYNYYLDYEAPWLTIHHKWSLRKMIIDSTTNIELLTALVNSADLRLQKIIDADSVDNTSLLEAIPFRSVSTRELAENRLKALKKSRN